MGELSYLISVSGQWEVALLTARFCCFREESLRELRHVDCSTNTEVSLAIRMRRSWESSGSNAATTQLYNAIQYSLEPLRNRTTVPEFTEGVEAATRPRAFTRTNKPTT